MRGHVHHSGPLKKDYSIGTVSSQQWRKMVEAYTRKRLTYESDLLPALSGIANRIYDRGRYLGGVWESVLSDQLAWYSSVDVIDSEVR